MPTFTVIAAWLLSIQTLQSNFTYYAAFTRYFAAGDTLLLTLVRKRNVSIDCKPVEL